jgi:hypothetical protein
MYGKSVLFGVGVFKAQRFAADCASHVVIRHTTLRHGRDNLESENRRILGKRRVFVCSMAHTPPKHSLVRSKRLRRACSNGEAGDPVTKEVSVERCRLFPHGLEEPGSDGNFGKSLPETFDVIMDCRLEFSGNDTSLCSIGAAEQFGAE